ncbi:uncharacterized protein LOC132191827 [Corylus avellana]|uniref:uncharacterized protein LOC132191827 n=1 Tax=Corylus avellana TaxID=13451 RepID=UPI001E2297E3|nr:uncharacterized protein LOC132191827 [Corylus avellana]
MADSSPYTKTHFPFSERNSPIQPKPKCQGKSFTNFLCKSLFFALFLVVLPLFPSQAPEFVSQTIVAKFWELIHLLFIGIAVSYGLFGRRKVDLDIEETHSSFDTSQSYVSRMFNVSSIFEDGFENPCGSDEKRLVHSWNTQFVESEDCFESSGVEEQQKPQFSMPENGFENPYGWNSQYFQGEPMVVLAQPNYGLDELGKSASIIDNKPLGLPIRSLKSTARKLNNPEFINGSESGNSGSKGSSNSSDRSKIGGFGDLDPMNLEQKFNEASAASPIPWRSRSVRMEMREKEGAASHPSHFRPLSVDETQFESLKSQSFRSTGSFSSQNSSISPSNSISSDLLNSSMEDLGEKKSLHRPSPEASPSPPKPTNGKASLNGLHSRRYSLGSMSRKDASRRPSPEASPSPPKPTNGKASLNGLHSRHYSLGSMSRKDASRKPSPEASPSPPKPTNVKASLNGLHSRHYSIGSMSRKDDSRNSENESKEWSKGRREDPLGGEDNGTDSLKSNMNPASLTKAPTKGKSVRTIRASGLTAGAGAMKNEEILQNQIDDKSKKKLENLKEAHRRTDKTKVGLDGLMIDTSKQSLDNFSPMPKETFSKYHKKEKEEFHENVAVGFEENSDNEAGSFQVSSEAYDVSGSGSVNDAGPDSDEVDKKAGEFIAKFREQIMLQKMASIERSRGLHTGGNYFR